MSDMNNHGQQPGPQKRRFRLEHWQVIALSLMLYDIVAVHAAYFVALRGRFDFVFGMIPQDYYATYRHFITFYSVFCVCCFWAAHLYRSMWRFAGYSELIRTMAASGFTSMVHTVMITVIFQRMPLTYYFWGALFQFALLLAPRFSYRMILLLRA